MGPLGLVLVSCALNGDRSPRAVVDLDRGWEFVRVPGSEEAKEAAPREAKDRSSWQSQYNIAYVQEGDDRFDLHGERLEAVKDAELSLIGGGRWEPAVLPHTAHVEALGVCKPWQGVCYYRRKLQTPKAWRGRSVVLTFEGAMAVSDVWLNGARIGGRRGGYLPVVLDLSGRLRFGEANEILVRLDNRDNPLVPPGKPTPDLDFLYWSGLYRDAQLTVTNAVHITDPVLANRPRGGGVVWSRRSVSARSGKAEVRTEVANAGSRAARVTVVQRLRSPAGVAASEKATTVTLGPGSVGTVGVALAVRSPRLWSPASPQLYLLTTSVVVGGREVDRVETRVGFRSLAFSRSSGFVLNGKPMRLIGTNRHQEYPYIGNALSKDAGYRDMVEIKAAGFNCVRLSHYPMNPAVLDACDELGLLVIPCIAGWQFFNSDPRFEAQVEQDIRDLIRRDRNHVCAMAWEMSLNETYPPAGLAKKWRDVSHEEFTAPDMTAVGDGAGGAPWDWVYNGWNEATKARPQDEMPSAPGYIREYGDYEFGGAESTSRQPRSAGEAGELQSAWNFVWSHNRNRSQWPWTIGDGTWVMYDYHRGYDTRVEYSGMADVFRIPRFIFRFFQVEYLPQPQVFAATYWGSGSSRRKVVVFSNSEDVELYVNGRKVASQKPDGGPDTPYGDYEKGGNPWDGGNCRHLAHPPFTFLDVPYQAGELRAVGVRAGRRVAEQVVRTPGKARALRLEANLVGRPLRADGADVVFVYASVVDANGTVVRDGAPLVECSVSGSGSVVGPSRVVAESGIATVLVRGGLQPGRVVVRARSGGLSGRLELRTVR